MADHSSIEWTDATWNPIVGCSIVSPGCTNCYAMKMAARLEKMNRTGGSNSNYVNPYDGTTKRVNGNTVWTGNVALAPNVLMAPMKRGKPTTYFVNSMGDLFHEDVPNAWIDSVFTVIASAPQHTFQLLTKRARRMRDYIDGAGGRIKVLVDGDWAGWPLPNVWLGVSTERQQEADERIPLLLETPTAIRFISAEPLLGPIDITEWLRDGHPTQEQVNGPLGMHYLRHGAPRLDWVIAGGESGPSARPMSIQWIRELRDQCAGAGVPFFFKQWGEWAPAGIHPSGAPGRFAFGDYEYDRTTMVQVDGYPRQFTKFGSRSTVKRVGKKAAGRLLDGVEHSEFPVPR